MKRWLTTLFVVFALAGGVLAGTPLHSGNMNGQMMKCCDKAKSKDQSPEANAARVCCALSCTSPMPTSPGSSFNSSPSIVVISDSIIKQIASFFIKENTVSTAPALFERRSFPQKSPPKYLQHHSFLI